MIALKTWMLVGPALSIRFVAYEDSWRLTLIPAVTVQIDGNQNVIIISRSAQSR